MTDFGGTAYVIKGEPTATDAARLRRALNDKQKTDVRDGLRRPLLDRTAAVLNPLSELETDRG